MGANVGAMKARHKELELRRGALLKHKEDLDREVKEIDRDCRILATAIHDAEAPPKTPEPAKSGEKVK